MTDWLLFTSMRTVCLWQWHASQAASTEESAVVVWHKRTCNLIEGWGAMMTKWVTGMNECSAVWLAVWLCDWLTTWCLVGPLNSRDGKIIPHSHSSRSQPKLKHANGQTNNFTIWHRTTQSSSSPTIRLHSTRQQWSYLSARPGQEWVVENHVMKGFCII